MTLAGGLTPSGFSALTQDEILANLNANTLTNCNAALDLSASEFIGQLWGIGSQQLSSAWAIVATIYNALNPNAAEGALLVSLCALTGTTPQAATYSTVTCNLTLNAGASVTAGFTAYVVGQPTNLWVLQSTVTNSGGSPATLPGVFRSLLPGPFAANANTLTQPSVSVIGLTAITNPLSAASGNPADTDTTLRARRTEELTGQGNGNIDSTRTHVLEVPGVLNAIATENTTLVTAGDGTPGRAFHVVIWDGPTLAAANNAIAQAIWSSKPSGGYSYGVTTGTATDAIGNAQTVLFDRATQEPIYLQFTTTPSSLTTAQTGAVKQAVVNYTNGTVDGSGNVLTAPAIGLGQSVVALALKSAALTSGVVTDVPTLTLNIGSYGAGTGNIAITGTQIATFSTGNIQVNGV